MGGGGLFWRSPRHYVPRDDGGGLRPCGGGSSFDEEIATVAALLRNDGAYFALRNDVRENPSSRAKRGDLFGKGYWEIATTCGLAMTGLMVYTHD